MIEPEEQYPLRNRIAKKNIKNQSFDGNATITSEPDEPQSFTEAIKAGDSASWQSAMQDEFNSLTKNKTWILVEKPNEKAISCKSVYKIKKDAESTAMKYKARLVAKGFNQVSGVDYIDTFSPVFRNSSLISLAAEMNLKMQHLKVETPFLNGDLEEEVYMQQPQGFVNEGEERFLSIEKIFLWFKPSGSSLE